MAISEENTDTEKSGRLSTEELRRLDVRDIIPQREPMLMISRITGFSPESCVTETEIKPGNILVEDGYFSCAGIVENMAQTCAALLGCVDRFMRDNEISIGYIGAVKDLKINRLPSCGEAIRTAVKVVTEAFGMTLVDATTYSGDEILASGELKIALAPKEDEK